VSAFGATVTPEGVSFSLWSPIARRVQLHLRPATGAAADRVLVFDAKRSADREDQTPEAENVLWSVRVPEARAGDRYAYSIDDAEPKPDPASRFQPDGVHGWSQIVDPRPFVWTDAGWTGLDPARAVLYEVHIGTFTPAGTFQSAIGKLAHLRDLGVTAIELMPLADFPGRRNWGYDGVALFAPSRAYGTPDDLRAFVNAAHETGLAVIVDVVYNHLGPEGAYLPFFSPSFLTSTHTTPWGDAVNLDGEGSRIVRRLLIDNALHWIDEYHADGLRLDATHALIDTGDPHFVVELVDAVRAEAVASGRPVRRRPLVFAEDARNLATLVEDRSLGGWGLDGVWADDFHHVVRRMLGGSDHGYYVDYRGDAVELATTLARGWLYTGQMSAYHRQARGTDPSRVEMRRAVVCVQNHDQVGNRPLGDRLHHTADPAAWRAAVAVLLMSPMTPLLFMGQEWSASTPFHFFSDFHPSLGDSLIEGRRREFQAFPEFAAPDVVAKIPDPQSIETFDASRLKWGEVQEPSHVAVLNLHRALLRLRAERPSLQGSDALSCEAEALDAHTVMFRRGATGVSPTIVVARLRGRGRVAVPALSVGSWRALLDTEDVEFARDSRRPRIDAASGTIDFQRPGAVIFGRQQP
jgi:maltooligosyltrehalose trehalohydrolase